MVQHALDVVRPAVEVDDKIDLAGFAEALGDENGDAAVRVMILGREQLPVVSMALGAATDEETARTPIGR